MFFCQKIIKKNIILFTKKVKYIFLDFDLFFLELKN
jgi:hypothetical protein